MGRTKRLDGLNDRIRQLIEESGKPIKVIQNALLNYDEQANSLVGNWIYNDSQPTAYYLVRICEYFDVSADWLLGLSDKRKRT